MTISGGTVCTVQIHFKRAFWLNGQNDDFVITVQPTRLKQKASLGSSEARL
jgi:hypothetical protein